MDRIIEFKGMDLQGYWRSGNLAIVPKAYNHVSAGSYISNSSGAPFAYHVRPETVVQFSGLVDRVGAKLYESDKGIYNHKPVLIIFYDGGFYMVTDDDDQQGVDHLNSHTAYTFLKTGNIHDKKKAVHDGKE